MCKNISNEIFNNPLFISTTPFINQCEGQTINILNNVNTLNASVLPLTYVFEINGTTTTNPIFTLVSGVNTVDITVTDGSGCTALTTMNINATPNSIVEPIFTITDANNNENIIKPCGSTNLSFNIQNPDPNYTYTWNFQGNSITGTSFTQSVNSTTNNPGYIPVILSLYDPNSGCNIDYYDTIISQELRTFQI